MTAVSQEVATYFAAQSVGVLGTSIFWGVEPTTPDNVGPILTVRDVPGGPPEPLMGTPSINVEHPGLQIIVRGARNGYAAAWTMAQNAFRAAVAVANQTLSGVYYLALLPTSSPNLLEYDGNDRPVIVFAVQPEKEPS